MIGQQIRLETSKGQEGLGRQTVAGWRRRGPVSSRIPVFLQLTSTHRPILSILAVNFCGLCPAAPVWWSIMARLMAMMIKIQENRPILGLNLHNIRFPLIEPLRLSEAYSVGWERKKKVKTCTVQFCWGLFHVDTWTPKEATNRKPTDFLGI